MKLPFAKWHLPEKDTPTTEKYFTGANRDLIRGAFSFANSARDRPYRRLGPHLFASGSNALLLRHATKNELDTLGKENFQRVIYLQDDDLKSIIHDPYINMEYRSSVEKFVNEKFQEILKIATDIVSPSQQIIEKYGSYQTHILGPSMLGEHDDLSHHDQEELLRIVFLGTRSHLNDLGLIATEISEFLKRWETSVQLDTFLGKWAPPQLKRLKNARHHSPASWRHFRRILTSHRWHLALAPMRDTPTNRARSWNKLLDHAAVGSATLHTSGACPMLDLAIGNGRYGLPVEGHPGQWREMLEWLISDRATVKHMAQAGLRRARQIGNPQDTRRFWKRLLLAK